MFSFNITSSLGSHREVRGLGTAVTVQAILSAGIVQDLLLHIFSPLAPARLDKLVISSPDPPLHHHPQHFQGRKSNAISQQDPIVVSL